MKKLTEQDTAGSGSEPTPLVGPGNTPNPSVGVLQIRSILPEPEQPPGIDHPMSPQAAGVPGASVAPYGMLIQPGSDVRVPLVPGMKPAMAPDVPQAEPGPNGPGSPA